VDETSDTATGGGGKETLGRRDVRAVEIVKGSVVPGTTGCVQHHLTTVYGPAGHVRINQISYEWIETEAAKEHRVVRGTY
jgi:hypothetical protein